VELARLERDPFCHVYGLIPAATYSAMLRNLPPKQLYVPLSLGK
jgi:hypothetical protein